MTERERERERERRGVNGLMNFILNFTALFIFVCFPYVGEKLYKSPGPRAFHSSNHYSFMHIATQIPNCL